VKGNAYSRTAKKLKKSIEHLAVLEYALPFTESWRRNEENRIGVALRCFGNFSNIPGESSRVILNKYPIYHLSDIFSPFRAENGIGDRSAEEHLKNPKPIEIPS
jgi:hypothetical protein